MVAAETGSTHFSAPRPDRNAISSSMTCFQGRALDWYTLEHCATEPEKVKKQILNIFCVQRFKPHHRVIIESFNLGVMFSPSLHLQRTFLKIQLQHEG
jgi:hypothetical protein